LEADVAGGGAVGRRDRSALAAGLDDRSDAEVRDGREVAAFVAAAAADVFNHGLTQADVDVAALVELKLSDLVLHPANVRVLQRVARAGGARV